MFMKSQTPVARGRSVAACASHEKKSLRNKTAAVVLGAALQVAVLSNAATAVTLEQNPIEKAANKIENLFDSKSPVDDPLKKATQESYVTGAQKGIDEAIGRAKQEAAKATEASDALGDASSIGEKKANDLAKTAAATKAAAEEATAARIKAVKDAASVIGPGKEDAQKLVLQTEKAEQAALKKAADAKSAAENAVADAVAYATAE